MMPSADIRNASQYPVLSDLAGEFRKSYGVGKGLFGLTEARVTYFVDSKGVVRCGEMCSSV